MPTHDEKYILAIDPGRDKLGIALLDSRGAVAVMRVVLRDDFPAVLRGLGESYRPETIAVGDGTMSDWVREKASEAGFERIVLVPERNTTLEARELAWKEDPPCWIWRMLPRLFRPTPADQDAWAAVVIGRRALTSPPGPLSTSGEG